MLRGSVPSKWDSPPGSPHSESPVHGKPAGRDVTSKNKTPPQDISASVIRLSVPDGLDHIRYRSPNKESFVFDVTTGYRFDPSTGLHYDANSGFFINYGREILLRWDPESNTYLRAGDFSGLGKPMTIPCAVQKVTSCALLGADLTSNEKTTYDSDSPCSRKKSKDGSVSSVEICEQSCSAEAKSSWKRTRKTDWVATRSKSNSPAWQRQDPESVHAGRSRCRSRRRTDQSEEMRRSTSWGRNHSRTDIQEPRRSSSKIARQSRCRHSRRRGCRETERSSSSRQSPCRVTRCSLSRERRRCSGELSKFISCSPSRMQTEPLSLNSSGHQRDTSGHKTQPDERHFRGTKRLSEAPNLQAVHPKKKKLMPRHNSHPDSRFKDETGRPEQRDRSREETPEYFVIDHCDTSNDGEQREESPGSDVIDYHDASDSKFDSQPEVGAPEDEKRKDGMPADVHETNRSQSHTTSMHSQKTRVAAQKSAELDNPRLHDKMGGFDIRGKSPEPIAIEDCDNSQDESTEGSSEVAVIDQGDMLGYLFTEESQTLTNILLIAPVPLQNRSASESDALRNQIGDPEGLLKVYINHESTSGSPCHFMLISFKSANSAKHWYDAQKGTVLLSSDRSKLKGYLHFLKKGNWNCKHCKSFNFFVQSICSKCYRAKNGGFSPVTISEQPTKIVGIPKLKGNFSSAENVLESLPPLHPFSIMSTKVMREPGGLSLGLCVFEVGSSEEGTKLCDFFIQQDRLAIYVILNEKPKTSDEIYLDSLFNKISSSNIVHVALIPLSTIPDVKLELSLMEIYLLMLLREDGAAHNQLATYIDEKVGAPYSYALITFTNPNTAAQWLDSRKKTFDNLTASNQRSKVSVHFTEDNWECKGCHTLNFSLRSLCHCCFKRKETDRLGPISDSLTATRWVAISRLPCWSKSDEDVVANLRELLKEFVFKGTEVIRDSNCPLLPLACVFEMHDKVEGIRLKEFLAREGRFPVFVDVHKELNERPSKDLSSAPDVIIVDEPQPECIDLTKEESCTQATEWLERPRAPNPRIPVVQRNPQSLLNLPVLMPPGIRKPPLQTSNNAPPQHPGPNWTFSGQTLQNPVPVTPLNIPVYEQPSPLRISYTVPFIYPSDLIIVSPVPYPGAAAKKFYTSVFLKDGADCESVDFCSENSFGVPYNYCLVKFRSSWSAKDWYNKRQGLMEITYRTFPHIKVERFEPMDAYLQLIGGNWLCVCGIQNSPSRSVCFKCYTQRGECETPLLNSSPTTTKYLGVKLYKWYSANELAGVFPVAKCKLYEVEKIRYVSDPMINKDHFGFYVFETTTPEAAARLRDFCMLCRVVKSTGYVLLKDPTAGAIIELEDFTFTPVVSLRLVNNERDFDLVSGNTEKPFVMGHSRKIILPDYETFLWTSLYGFYLDNPPTNIVMISLCPGGRDLPKNARAQIQISLEDIGINVNNVNIIFCFKENYGSPFSYCLLTFDSVDAARKWYHKCKGTFQFKIPPPDNKAQLLNLENCLSLQSTSQSNSFYFIESKLYYILPNWLCFCGSSNFPLRSVCHNCLGNRSGRSAYVSRPHPTNFVGIRLTRYFPNIDLSRFNCIRKRGHKFLDVKLFLDSSLPRDPSGVVIFQMNSTSEAIKLFKFFTACTLKQIYSIHLKGFMELLVGCKMSNIKYLMVQTFLESAWTNFQSENWDRYFSNAFPTNIIAIHHPLLKDAPPVFNIPIGPFGGTIKQFKKGGGFTSTFWFVTFLSPEGAKAWYDANCGELRNQNNRLNLYFTDGIWMCRQCHAPNFPVRVLCYRCYTHKITGDRLLKSSPCPTRWVGINIQHEQNNAFASLENKNIRFKSVRIIIDPVVRQDGPSVLVFEVSSPAMGAELSLHFTIKKLNPQFFVVHESYTPIYAECSEVVETITPDNRRTDRKTTTAPDSVISWGKEHTRPSTSYDIASAKRSRPKKSSADTTARIVSLIERENSDFDENLVCISDDETEKPASHQSISSSVAPGKEMSCVLPDHSQASDNGEFRSLTFATVLKEPLSFKKTELHRSQVAISGKFSSSRFASLFENKTVNTTQSRITSSEEFGSSVRDHRSAATSQLTLSEKLKGFRVANLFGDEMEKRVISTHFLADSNDEPISRDSDKDAPAEHSNRSQVDPNDELSSSISDLLNSPEPSNSDSNHTIISVCPVPRPGRNAQQYYSEVLSNNAIDCLSVKYCQGNLLGVSYDYCLVYFVSLESAAKWHKMTSGRIKITNRAFPSIQVERFKTTWAVLCFSGDNWQCDCGKENSPMRSICFECYKPKGKDTTPFEPSFTPTKWLGVKLDKWYAKADLVKVFSEFARNSYGVTKISSISDPRILKDHFGIYIVEAMTPEDAVYLRNYCCTSPFVGSACFVILNNPSSCRSIELEIPVMSAAFSSTCEMSKAVVIPDYETIFWISFYGSRLENPPSDVVMISLCPGTRELPDEARTKILNSIQESGVNHESVLYRYKRDVGSPFSYCLISFDSVDSAKSWVDKCNGTIQFNVPCPEYDKKPVNFQSCYPKTTSKGDLSYFIKSKLHYSFPDWVCSCGTPNVFLRSLCHNCYKNKNGESYFESISRPAENSSDGVVWSGSSKYVGIKLSQYFPKLDISKLGIVRKLDCSVSKISVCMDPELPRDPCGIVIFELKSVKKAVKLHKYLTETPRGNVVGILKNSSGIIFLKCKESLKSTCDSPENLGSAQNQTPTNTIVFHHRSPQTLGCAIPVEPYGGRMVRCKAFTGFFETFWLVHFPDTKAAKIWYDTNCGKLKTMNAEFPQPTLYFSEDLWTCRNCSTKNFPLRDLCYVCFGHKGNERSPLRRSNDPTRWIGIPVAADHKLAVEILAREASFPLKSIRIFADPNVRENGTFVLVFEMFSSEVGLKAQLLFADKNIKNHFFTVYENSESQVTIEGMSFPPACSQTPNGIRDKQAEDSRENAGEQELPLGGIGSADASTGIDCENSEPESGGGYETVDECVDETDLCSHSALQNGSNHISNTEKSEAEVLTSPGIAVAPDMSVKEHDTCYKGRGSNAELEIPAQTPLRSESLEAAVKCEDGVSFVGESPKERNLVTNEAPIQCDYKDVLLVKVEETSLEDSIPPSTGEIKIKWENELIIADSFVETASDGSFIKHAETLASSDVLPEDDPDYLTRQDFTACGRDVKSVTSIEYEEP